MNQTEIGTFIAKCRKEQKLTQAQLAEKLNITDRAVSKWETGKSMPDSSIMLELCAILGITVNELLSGEKIEMAYHESYEKKAEENLVDLKRKDENSVSKNRIVAILYSTALFIAIAVCLICDLAISGVLTWSLIPLSSIAFAWVDFPERFRHPLFIPIEPAGKNTHRIYHRYCNRHTRTYILMAGILDF